MRDQLDHLPEAKQRELADVVRILFEEFELVTRLGTQPHNKQGRILKLVLYGSHVRGDWVDDPVGGYHSDYDILVVVNYDRLTDFDYWSAAEDRLMREMTIAKTLTAQVGLIVHSLTDLNAQIVKGQPFFLDIVDQGIALYEAEGFPLAQPGRLPLAEQLVEARKHFQRWFDSALRRRDLAETALQKGYLKEAAFDYHQTAEQFYHCVMLVLTLYSPLCRARHNGLYAER